MLQRYKTRNRQVYSKGARTQRVLTKPSELVPPLQQRAPPFACVAAAAVGVRERAHRVREPTRPCPDCWCEQHSHTVVEYQRGR